MSTKRKTPIVFSILIILVFLLSACATQPAAPATEAAKPPEAVATEVPPTEEPVSVALIMAGSIADGGWNTLGYKGLEQLKEEGFKTAYTENVDPANIATVARGYADDGYDLVIGHGWQFSTAFMEVAPQYPDQKFFVVTTGPEEGVPANLAFFDPSAQYQGYMAGALAALVSKSNTVGFVGGGDNPVQRMVGNAYAQGAEETVPGTKVLQVITGDYNDAAKGREAALTMIGNGADTLWHAADITGLGVVTGAVEGKALMIGCYSDQCGMAYPSFASSVFEDLTFAVYDRAHAVKDGTFTGGGNWKPPFQNIFYFICGSKETPYNTANVPPDAVAKLDEIMKKLQDGTIQVAIDMD